MPASVLRALAKLGEDISAARLAGKVARWGYDKWHVQTVTRDVITFAADQQVVDVERLDQILAKASSPLTVSTLRRGTTRVATVEFGEANQTQDVTALENEVKSLQDEVRKLREELAKAKAHP